MTSSIIRVTDVPTLPAPIENELERLRERFWRYAQASTSQNTKRSYVRAWNSFVVWCNTKGVDALPSHPETVAWYAIALATGEAGRKKPLKMSSITTELAAIARAHVESKLPPPTRDPYLRIILRGMRREHGLGAAEADPLLPEHVRAMVACVEPGLTGIRDFALLTFGLAAGLRRIEIATLRVEHLKFRSTSCDVLLPRSKTDQEGQGKKIGVHQGQHLETCPLSALHAWLGAASIREGYVFRKVIGSHVVGERLNERTVDAIVRDYVARTRAQYPAAIPEGRYSAHSLRAGCATMMFLAGKSDLEIRDHLRHNSLTTTARYVRLAKLRGSTATKGVGL